MSKPSELDVIVEMAFMGHWVRDPDNGSFMRLDDKYNVLSESLKQEVKDLFISLVGDAKGINPNNKDFYDGYKLAQVELREKIARL